MYSDFLILPSEAEYEQYYLDCYCSSPLTCCDGLPVYFKPQQFNHAFRKSADRIEKDKSLFDWDRAKRIGWIKLVLEDTAIPIQAGYDNKKKCVDHSRRVKVVTNDRYTVIVRTDKKCEKAFFVTAWTIDNKVVFNLLSSVEKWDKAKIR